MFTHSGSKRKPRTFEDVHPENQSDNHVQFGRRGTFRAGSGDGGNISDWAKTRSYDWALSKKDRLQMPPSDGPHAGRGPKGYRRSDERIREDVCEFLTRSSDVDASSIEVSVAEGVVTLSGTVIHRSMKRLAEAFAASARGVADVVNELRVEQNESPSSEC